MIDLGQELEQHVQEMFDLLGQMPADPVTAIHSFRKRGKSFRAILKLSPEPTAAIKNNIRGISRILSPFRDAQVNWETYATALEQSGLADVPTLRTALSSDYYYVYRLPAEDKRMELAAILLQVQADISLLNFPQAAARLGLKQSFRSAQDAFRGIHGSSSPASVHNWRKAVKQLWYQTRMWLPPDNGESPVIHPLDTLGKRLGDIHDADVLSAVCQQFDASDLHKYLQSYRTDMLDQALIQGRALLGDVSPEKVLNGLMGMENG